MFVKWLTVLVDEDDVVYFGWHLFGIGITFVGSDEFQMDIARNLKLFNCCCVHQCRLSTTSNLHIILFIKIYDEYEQIQC